jgi:hypothetical protein
MFAAAPGKHTPISQKLFCLTLYQYLLQIGTKFFGGYSKYRIIKRKKFAESTIKKFPTGVHI